MTPQNRRIEDGLLYKDFALPAAASTATSSPVLDIDAFSKGTSGTGGIQSPGASGIRPPKVEIAIDLPVLSTTILPDTKTATLTITASDDPAFGSSITLGTKVATGAGGVGTPFTKLQVVIPPDCPRYLKGTVTFGANATDGSALKAHFALRF